MIQTSFVRVHKGLMDYSWVDLHYQFMGGITLLFLVWNSPEIREQARQEWAAFKSCLVQWELILGEMVTRWDRVSRAKEVVSKLADATVDIVERDMTKSTTHEKALRDNAFKFNRDRDRMRSIMQQLGTSSPTYPQNVPLTSRQLHNGSLARLTTDTEEVERESMASHHAYLTSTGTLEQSRQPLPQPHSPQQTVVPDALPDYSDGTTPVAYLTSTSPDMILDTDWAPTTEPPQTMDTLPFVLPEDLSAVLNEEMWSNFGPYDNTIMPGNLGRFEYFPVPIPSVGTSYREILADNSRSRSMAWADSVLNFQGSWDNDSGQDT